MPCFSGGTPDSNPVMLHILFQSVRFAQILILGVWKWESAVWAAQGGRTGQFSPIKRHRLSLLIAAREWLWLPSHVCCYARWFDRNLSSRWLHKVNKHHVSLVICTAASPRLDVAKTTGLTANILQSKAGFPCIRK